MMAPKIAAVSDTQPAVLRATQITAAASTDSFVVVPRERVVSDLTWRRASNACHAQMGARTQIVFAWHTTPLGFDSGTVDGVPAPHLPKQMTLLQLRTSLLLRSVAPHGSCGILRVPPEIHKLCLCSWQLADAPVQCWRKIFADI